MVPRNVEYLRENGPATMETLPNQEVTVKDKQHGVWRFWPKLQSNAGGKRTYTTGQTVAVYYLHGEHDPVDVIEVWLSENGSLLEIPRNPLMQAIHQVGGEFRNVEGRDLREVTG